MRIFVPVIILAIILYSLDALIPNETKITGLSESQTKAAPITVSRTKPAPTMIVEVLMPKHAQDEEVSGFALWKKDPEAYANMHNQNLFAYNRSLSYASIAGVKQGDTVQIRYYKKHYPPQKESCDLVSNHKPFVETVEENVQEHIEYLTGIVVAVK